MHRCFILALVALGLFVSGQAYAHDLGLSRLVLDLDHSDQAELVVSLEHLGQAVALQDINGDGKLQASELEAALPAITAYFKGRLRLLARDDQPCQYTLSSWSAREKSLSFILTIEGSPAAIESSLFRELLGTHQLIVEVHHGAHRWQDTLDEEHSRLSLPQAVEVDEQQPFLSYLKLGVEHIFMGFDHLLFLLTLLLVARRLRKVLVLVSGFTIAHSCTLAVAALGWWIPPGQYIEPLIALSVFWVAVENILREEAQRRGQRWLGFNPEPRWRVLWVLLFGLIHGFGFAGVFLELGLSSKELALSLLGFNLGVELGQLLMVAAIWPILWLLMKREHYSLAVKLASGFIAMIACYWLVERLFVS